MRVLLAGAHGQLGRALVATCPPSARLVALGSTQLDITQPAVVEAAVAAHSPDLIVNAAAYTDVDRAESEAARAMLVNCEGAGNLARAAHGAGARLVHISTDYVFDGRSALPWLPSAQPHPINAYGRSKLAGEEAVLSAGNPRTLVLRTSWVYSSSGRNFVTTMLRLMSSRPTISIVSDQVGAPTWATSLAGAIWRLVDLPSASGVHHFTDAGVASWYDLAVAIQEEATALDLLTASAALRPIRSSHYPTPARRPAFSVLDAHDTWSILGGPPAHWRVMLRHALEELRAT